MGSSSTESPSASSEQSGLVDGRYSITDLVDVESFRETLELFSRATGFTTGFISHPGREVLFGTGWRDICTAFHRADPRAAEVCKRSNVQLTAALRERRALNVERCQHGLVDGATPIIVRGVHIASLATGQILFEQPDPARFRAQAERFGFDPEAYLAALNEVPVVSEERFQDALSFLADLAATIAEVGLQNLELREQAERLEAEVAERKRAQAALRASEERYRTLFEDANDAIFLLDRGRFTSCNQRAVELTGRSREDLLRIGPLELSPVTQPDGRCTAERFEQLAAATERGGRQVFEWRQYTSGGEVQDVEVSLSVVELAEGRQLMAHVRDITARKRAEGEKLDLEQRLGHLRRMEAIATLAGGIAHDFNNMLGAITGYTELATDVLPPGSPARSHLGNVLRASHRARDLVARILTFAHRGEHGREPVDLVPIVRESLRFLRASIPATIEIQERIDAPGAVVLADAGQIYQLVMNLCTNAYHAMREAGGALEVGLQRVDRIGPSAQDGAEIGAGPYVQLTVWDSGVGMAPEVAQRCFEPFFTTKGRGEGTGMGLSVVHGVVKAHGGALGVESSQGKGSLFSVWLPAHEQAPRLLDDRAQPLIRGSERILVVDDDPMVRAVGRRLLESLGYTVAACSGAEEALAALEEDLDGFDLLITDQTMPRVTGAELARRAMALRPGLPVIICTGHSDLIDQQRASELGARALLYKPLDRSTLSRVVREVLDGER
jgi:two-component system cell cycle sensor histidine kinase/response regulator CckA